jgi:small-conductance mechanosensitive channel
MLNFSLPWGDFQGTPLVLELLLLSLSVALAWLISRRLGRGQSSDSILFGRHVLDGLLFPVLTLLFCFVTRMAWQHSGHPVLLLKLAMPVLLALVAIRFAARVLRAAFPTSRAMHVLERGLSWLAWLMAVLWIVGLLPTVLEELDAIQLSFGKSHISVRTLLEGLLSSSLVLVLALWLSATIERKILQRAVDDLSMRKVLTNTLRAALLFLGLLLALSAVGVDLTALSVLGGALGVGLGLGLQKLAANYVSGFVILLERSLRIGDTVKVDGFEGVVTDIKTRFTLIRAVNGRESVVPNELIITQRVENLSLADPRLLLTSSFTVGYDSDVDQVRALAVEAALSSERVLAEPAPVAHLLSLAADGLEFSLCYWIEDPENGQLPVRSQVHMALLRGLRAASIEIPYPQRVVHVHPHLPAAEPSAKP